MRSTSSILACVLLTACAGRTKLLPEVDTKLAIAEVEKQNEIFLTDYRDHLIQASTVFANIARANAAHCPKAGPLYTGMMATNAGGFPNAQRAAARKVFGNPIGANDVDDQPWVFHVIAGSPADRSGIRVGDRILDVGGVDVGTGARGQAEMMNSLRAAAANGPIALTVKRGDETITMAMSAEKACDYGFGLRRSERIVAFADGSKVEVTTGLLRFVKTDDELALIVGHELAHKVLGHRDTSTQNAVTGGILGASGALLAAGPLGAAVGIGLAVQGATMGARLNSQAHKVRGRLRRYLLRRPRRLQRRERRGCYPALRRARPRCYSSAGRHASLHRAAVPGHRGDGQGNPQQAARGGGGGGAVVPNVRN